MGKETDMDHKKNAQRRQKRQSKGLECGNYWDCSVCTYRNTAEAFKCAMCDVRKGTSTRKPRLNPQLVAQQVAQQLNTVPSKLSRREGSKERKPNNSTIAIGNTVHPKAPKKQKIRTIRPRLQNVDRTAVHEQPVTVNNVTVVITEFLPTTTTSTQPTNSPQKKNSPSSADVPIMELRTKAEIVSVNGDGVAASTL